MQPHDPNAKRPTKFVGGSGHWNKRGKEHKGKGKK